MNSDEATKARSDGAKLSSPHSSVRRPVASSLRRSAFTLIEMLTAVALLVIVLGLMVSLARYVRNRSATQLTREILANLNDSMSRYVEQYSDKPHVPVLVESVDLPDEQTLLRSAELNNRRFVAQMQNHLVGPFWWSLPGSVYDKSMLRDAWGTPIVLMPAKHNAIGMAPGNKSFFFSAGPDRLYHTREDNLYSYELAGK